MSDLNYRDDLVSPLRTAQIIVFALFLGVVGFAVVVVIMGRGKSPPPDGSAAIGFLMAGFSIVLFVARFFVAWLLDKHICDRVANGTWQTSGSAKFYGPPPASEDHFLVRSYLTVTVVLAAMLECAAICNLLAFLLDNWLFSLVLGIMFALGLLISFPTRASMLGWLEICQRRIEEIGVESKRRTVKRR